MKNPKVTVLMPVYNAEKFLKEAIDSILNQTFTDFEFIIINDASTDNAKKIIMSCDDKRIRYFENISNLGVARTLNRGLRIAKGKYIARMDADDISLPDRLKEQLLIIEEDSEVGLVATWISLIDEKNNEIGKWREDRNNNSPEEIFYSLFFSNCIAHSSVFFKKEIVLKIGGYNELFDKAQDYELWTRLVKRTKMVKIKKVKVKRRIHARNKDKLIVNHKLTNENKIFLKNADSLLSEKFNSEILLRIRFNNSFSVSKKSDLSEILKVFNRINTQLINKAPSFLNKEKLGKCAKRKRMNIIKKTLIKAIYRRFFYSFR